MTVPSPARRASALQASALVTGYLVVMSFAMVGAWPTTVVLGTPVLVAAVIAPRARRAAGVLAAVPALVVVVWWVAYNIGRGFRIDDGSTEIWFLLAGPAAAVTVPLAVLALMPSGRDRFSGEPVRA
jgi:hypothetical protein